MTRLYWKPSIVNYELMSDWPPPWHYCNVTDPTHYCFIWYSLSGVSAIPDVLPVAFIMNSFNDCSNMCICIEDGVCFKSTRNAEVNFMPFCKRK